MFRLDIQLHQNLFDTSFMFQENKEIKSSRKHPIIYFKWFSFKGKACQINVKHMCLMHYMLTMYT